MLLRCQQSDLHLVAGGEQAIQQPIQRLQLAAQAYCSRQPLAWHAQLRAGRVQVAQQGVVADVAQLHDGVVDALHAPAQRPSGSS